MSTDPSKKPMPSGAERRRDIRRIVHERCPVLVFTEAIIESGGEPIQGVIIDISTKGAGLILDRVIKPGTKIIIEIHSTKFPRTTVRDFAGQVAWYKELPTSGKVIKRSNSLNWRTGLQVVARSQAEGDYFQKMVRIL